MILNICEKRFESEKILSLQIREREVFIDYENDFYRLKYKDEADIRDALLYNKLQKLTYQDIYDAMSILINVCDVYINSKTMCQGCPLHKQHGCNLQSIPINWA